MVKSNSAQIIDLSQFVDSRGVLSVIDNLSEVTFKPERIFIISKAIPGELRGRHAHKDCWQLLIPVGGDTTVTVFDGSTTVDFSLKSQTTALCVPPLNWVEFELNSNEASLVVLASAPYDANDYIFSKEELAG